MTNEREYKQESLKQLPTLAKGGATFLMGYIAGSLLRFLLHVMIARGLGSSGYGAYAFALAIVGICQNVAKLGISRSMVRFVSAFYGAGDKANYKRVTNMFLKIVLVSSSCIVIIMFTLGGLFVKQIVRDELTYWVFLVLLFSIVFTSISGWASSLLRSLKMIKEAVFITEIITPVTRILFICASLMIVGNLIGISIAHLLSTVAIVPIIVIVVRKCVVKGDMQIREARPVQGIDEVSYRYIIRVSVPLFLSSFSYILVLYMDRLMLGYFTDNSSVGVYNAASQLTIQSSFVFMAITRMFAPMIAENYATKDMDAVSLIYRKATWWSFVLTVPICSMLVFNSRMLMTVYGNEFVQGWLVLVILAVGQLYNVATGPAGRILQMTGKQDVDFVGNLCLLLINICLNAVLIPKFGVVGAAMATVFSVCFLMSFRLYMVYRYLRIQPFTTKYVHLVLCVIFLIVLAYNLNLMEVDGFLIMGFSIVMSISVIGFMKFMVDEHDVAVFKSLVMRPLIGIKLKKLG